MAIHSREKKDRPINKKPGGSDGGKEFRKRGKWTIKRDSHRRNVETGHSHSPPGQNSREGHPQ